MLDKEGGEHKGVAGAGGQSGRGQAPEPGPTSSSPGGELSTMRCDAMRCAARWMERWPRRGVEMGDGDGDAGAGTGASRLSACVLVWRKDSERQPPWGVEVTLESGAYGVDSSSSSLNIEASCPLPGCADGGGSGGSGGGWWGLPKRRRSKRAGG